MQGIALASKQIEYVLSQLKEQENQEIFLSETGLASFDPLDHENYLDS